MSDFFDSFPGLILVFAFAFVMIITTLHLTSNEPTANQQIEFAKAGLQQCPNPQGTVNSTIWLRECLPLKK